MTEVNQETTNEIVTSGDSLSANDVVRVESTNPVFDKNVEEVSVVESVEDTETGAVAKLLNCDGTESNTALRYEADSAEVSYFRGSSIATEWVTATIEFLGQAPDRFGEEHILYRPDPRRYHIGRKNLRGFYESVCHFSASGHRQAIPVEYLTERQTALLDMCSECVKHAQNNPHEIFPIVDDFEAAVGDPFLCPECGEPPKRITHDQKYPPGMESVHEDGSRCVGWDSELLLEWRLQPHA